MRSATRNRMSQGTKRVTAAALRRRSTTPHMPQRLMNVMGLAPPPLGLERAEGQEERESDHRQVVDEVLGVDDPFGKAVHVLDDRRLLDDGPERALRGVREPAEEPQGQERPEGTEARHDLILGGGRHEEADGEEGGPDEEQPEIARQHGAPLDLREPGHGGRIEEGQGKDERIEAEGGEELPREHLPVPQRIGQEKLHGPRALLLGEETHGEHGDEEEQHHRHVVRQGPQDVLGGVEALPHLRLHGRPHRELRVLDERGREEKRRDEEEEGGDGVGHRRAEVEPHLLLEDRHPPHQAVSCTLSTICGACSSPATTRRKTSSSERPTWCSSRSVQPRPATSCTSSPRTSRPRGDSTTNREVASTEASVSTDVTPGKARSELCTAWWGPPISTSTRAAGKTCCTSSDCVPCATMRPRLMMMMLSQTIETSGRMCVERMTVCWPPSDLMSARISAIWRGSRPMVGSSRISTSGSPRRAWATPTRCRYPFESLPMRRCSMSEMEQRSITSATLERRSPRETPLASATKSRYAATGRSP